uniref:Uncharacterized protein n=1 Tax=Anguilla anguilla TaxID=7936 RepID=A0A0E9R6S0_ANGAN
MDLRNLNLLVIIHNQINI